MSLPGTTRGLPTVDDHVNRLDNWLPDLWANRELYMIPCGDESTLVNQTTLLRQMRDDIAVLRGSHAFLEAQLRAIVAAEDTFIHNPGAMHLISIAKEALNDQKKA